MRTNTLVGIPLVARLRSTASQGRGEHLAEAQAPFADAFVADHDPALGQDQLDVTQAQAEAMVEPDSVLDDLSRKAKAAIRIQRQVHGRRLPSLSSHAKLTTPALPVATGVQRLRRTSPARMTASEPS